MRKVVAAINMTLDGFCDHTAGVVNEELHQHFEELIHNAGVILYGRITYQLMTFWQALAKEPSGKKDMDDFAIAIDKVPKLVFSKTLTHLDWPSAQLASHSLEEVVTKLRQQPGKDILVGSPSLIATLTQQRMIDEYQLSIHPVILGNGLPLFKNISEQVKLELIKTKTFSTGVVTHYYTSSVRK